MAIINYRAKKEKGRKDMGKEKKKKRNSGREENEVWGNCLQQQKGIRGNE